MRWILLLTALLLSGCATTKSTIIISGQLDGIDVAAVYELGGSHETAR
jgi:uncharacterized lipoprotein YmbA